MTCGARPSTAASPTNRPPIVLSRTSAIRVGAGAGSSARAAVACEDGGRGGDPERGGERARAAAPQPGERQADDVPRAAQDGRSWRRRYARAFSRPPQTCIEHQLDERLREPS